MQDNYRQPFKVITIDKNDLELAKMDAIYKNNTEQHILSKWLEEFYLDFNEIGLMIVREGYIGWKMPKTPICSLIPIRPQFHNKIIRQWSFGITYRKDTSDDDIVDRWEIQCKKNIIIKVPTIWDVRLPNYIGNSGIMSWCHLIKMIDSVLSNVYNRDIQGIICEYWTGIVNYHKYLTNVPIR